MRVDIWSDVQHPWSYIGKRRFDRALATFRHGADVVVVHRSFRLDPGVAAGETVRAERPVASALGASIDAARRRMISVQSVGATEGLELRLLDTMVGDTLAAHQLLHLAAAYHLQWTLLERLFRAHFTEARSVLDHESLKLLAAEVGIDRGVAARVLATGEHVEAVRADMRHAEALGASAVPFFLFDGVHRVVGAQPTEAFSFVLERVWAETSPGRLVVATPLSPSGADRGPAR